MPVAPHDCTGPVVFMAACHFSLHARNTLIQEIVRAFYTGWYTELVTALPDGEKRSRSASGMRRASASSFCPTSPRGPTPSSA